MEELLLQILRVIAAIIIGIPAVLIFCVGYLLYLPFDIFRYHKMPYYQDLGIRYKLFLTSTDQVRPYNRIVRERLPITYFVRDGLEYFVKDDQVLICGWGCESFEQEGDQWYCVVDGEDTTRMPIKEILANELERVKPEHKSLNGKILIFYSDVTDAEEFEEMKSCPYFYCVASADDE